MAFVKKTWEDRDSEYPNRRSLTDPTTGTTEIRDIGFAEGDVYVEGDEINAENFNDLEQRIENAIDEIPITEVEVTPVVTDGETLATIRVNEDTSDIKMPKPFVVTITYASGEYTADKTVAEIYAAAENGYEVYALYGMETFDLAGYSRSSASFINVYNTASSKTSTIRSFGFRANGTITLDSKILYNLPSISSSSSVGRIMTVSSVGGENRYALTTDNTIDDAHTNAKRTYSSQKVNAELQARDAEIALKANSSDVNTALALKADKADTYTKTQVDTALSAKANTSDVTASLALKADKADTYTKTQVDTALGNKADKATTYTKSEVDTALSAKANSADLSTVATSGDYDDLLNKPTIPTATSQLTNDSDYQTGEQVSQAIATKADTDGTYEDMTVGTAMKLVATRHTTDTAPYLFRQSGGDNNAYVGTEETDKLVGASAVVNQSFNYNDGIGKNNGTIEVSNNSLTFTVTNKSTYQYINQPQAFLAGHKVLVFLDVTLSENETVGFGYGGGIGHLTSCAANTKKHIEYIDNFTNSANIIYVYLARTAGLSVGATAIIDKFNIIDLTAMFGTTIANYIYSLEQATAGSGIAYLRKYGFFTKDYIPYTPNTLQSVNTSKHVMRDGSDVIIGEYALPSTELRGLYKLDASNNLYADGDTLESDGTLTRKRGSLVIDGVNVTVDGAQGLVTNGYAVFITISNYGGKRNNNLISDKFVYEALGYNSMHAMSFGGTSGAGTTMWFILPSDITNLTQANAWFASNPTTVIYELATPTTEQATGFTNPQVVSKFGTEEYTDERDFPLPVGHETDYPLDSEMALPIPPVTAGTYNLQLTVDASGNQTYSWAT